MPEAGQGTKMTQLCFVVFGGLWGGQGGRAGHKNDTVVLRCVWWVVGSFVSGGLWGYSGSRGRAEHKNDTVVPCCVWWVAAGLRCPRQGRAQK